MASPAIAHPDADAEEAVGGLQGWSDEARHGVDGVFEKVDGVYAGPVDCDVAAAFGGLEYGSGMVS